MTSVWLATERDGAYRALLEAAGMVVDDPEATIALADPDQVGELDFGRLRWVQSTWAGVDAIDWGRVPAGVVVTNLPGLFGPQMAEFVFGHLLARTQRIPQRYATRTWDETVPETLAGSTIGILGAGSIGAAIATVARVFGMRVRGCRRSGDPDPRYDAMFSIDDVEAFADGLDHLVALLPATPATTGLVDGSLFRRLAPGATFINVGRGSTVVTDDVVAAVRAGTLGLAVLDVTDPEPLGEDHPAWETPGIVITGHTAAHSRPEDVVAFFLDNFDRFRSGEELRGVVDRDRGY